MKVLIAPHIDDEINCASTILASLDRIIYVTDSATQWAGPVMSVEDYIQARKEGAISLSEDYDIDLVFLDWPNDYLGRLAVDKRKDLIASIAERCVGAEIIIVPYPGDSHPEHVQISAIGAYIGSVINVPVIYCLGDGEEISDLDSICGRDTVVYEVKTEVIAKQEIFQKYQPDEFYQLSSIEFPLRTTSEIFHGPEEAMFKLGFVSTEDEDDY